MRPLALIVLVMAGLVGACARPADDAVRGGHAGDEIRIVSLSPAISRTLVDLGLEKRIVGRTPFCDALARHVPVVGDLLDLNWEQLVRVRPTHVLVQPPATGVDRAMVRQAQSRGWSLGLWHLDDVDDIRRLLREIPNVLFNEEDGERPRIAQRAEELIARIDDALAQPDADAFTGRTLLVVGLEPITVFGQGTYLHDLLIALGGVNAITMRGYPQLTLEDVSRIDPDAIVLVRPGGGEGAERLGPLARLNVKAIRGGRVATLAHPDAFTPSSAVAAVAEELRDVLRAFTEAEPRMSTNETDGAETSKRRNAETSKESIKRCAAPYFDVSTLCCAVPPGGVSQPFDVPSPDVWTFGRFDVSSEAR